METWLHHNCTRSPGLHRSASERTCLQPQRLWKGTKEVLPRCFDDGAFEKVVDKMFHVQFLLSFGAIPPSGYLSFFKLDDFFLLIDAV